ncbi:hypothetical protein C9J12_21260 [Photobacterium frigidiphilum]|uniref:Uncharacterized protein n=1 Tax=Photobacterium frigidiphilum TaxID=264736 RepID=A0A2T3JAC2_9GAMM|nr:hypothetical protein [Photobacterium frigidiphilum]PSU45771.1 hypothetical protein C9J12_21260 [Photobacterium frigidiphilum]
MTLFAPRLEVVKLTGRKRILLSKLAEKNPGKFAHVTVHNGYLHRYSSNVPAIAYAEACLASISSKELDWCLLAAVPNGLFAMAVVNGVVRQTMACALGDDDMLYQRFDIDFARAKCVYLIGDVDMTSLCNENLSVIETSLSDAVIEKYTLTVEKSRKVPMVMTGVLLLALICGVFFNQPSTDLARESQVPVDPYSLYRSNMDTAITAESVIENAIALGAYATLLPVGWDHSDITFSENTLSMIIQRKSNAPLALMRAWQEQHPAIAPYLTFDANGGQMAVPIPASMTAWKDKVMPDMNSVFNNVFDTVIAMGWDIAEVQIKNQGPTVSHAWTMNQDAMLSRLTLLLPVFRVLPVNVVSLTMKPISTGKYVTQITLTIQGEPDE